MKKFAVLALIALVPAANVLAQSSLDDEINAELDRMYSRSNSAKTSGNAPSVQVNVQTNPVANANNNQVSDQKMSADQATKAAAAADSKADQKNEQAATSAAKADSKAEQAQAAKADTKTIVKNPVTVITSTPLTESRIDQIRKARQELEIQSETRIAERLEQSRIEDEKRRAEALFGDRFQQMVSQGQTKVEQNNTAVVAAPIATQPVVQQPVAPAPAPAPQPTIIVLPIQQAPIQQPAPVVEPKPVEKVEPVVAPVQKVEAPKVEETKEIAPAVVATPVAVSSGSVATAQQEEVPSRVGYMGVGLGMGEYVSAKNVRGNYSLSVAGGTKINDRILVDGAFSMANYDVEQFDSGPLGYDPLYPRITEMNQYALAGTMKYQLMTGTVRPSVGGTVQYTYRTFADKQLGFANNDATSHAIDTGLVVGLDFEMSPTMSIGVDYRYMFNLYNRAGSTGFQTRFASQVVQSNNPIEKFNYQTVSIMGRFSF